VFLSEAGFPQWFPKKIVWLGAFTLGQKPTMERDL
jgi:hypothetical protein